MITKKWRKFDPLGKLANPHLTKWITTKSSHSILGIKDIRGVIKNNSKGISKAFANFFNNLFSKKETDDGWLNNLVLNKSTISPHFKAKGDIEPIIRNLPQNSAPGPDGIPYEFYKK